jgi:hypothetical protein
VAILKKVLNNRRHALANSTRDVTVPSFSYPPTSGLAQVIVDVWANAGHILDRNNNGVPTQAAVMEATQKIQTTAGLDLQRVVIITEQEHDDDYTMQADNEIVFVLPDKNRVTNPVSAPHLLDTVKLLMACTPNGI